MDNIRNAGAEWFAAVRPYCPERIDLLIGRLA